MTLTIASILLVTFWVSYEAMNNTRQVIDRLALWSTDGFSNINQATMANFLQ